MNRLANRRLGIVLPPWKIKSWDGVFGKPGARAAGRSVARPIARASAFDPGAVAIRITLNGFWLPIWDWFLSLNFVPKEPEEDFHLLLARIRKESRQLFER